MKRLLGLFCCGLTACTSVEVPTQFEYQEIQTSTFKIATWQKITNPSAPFKIYIEGDGYAFRANGRLSSNPTPHGTLVRELAFADSHDNVVYMARPCQFVKDEKCAPKYWSTARFSPQTIQAQYEATRQIADRQPVTLVGFSGGAQIAGLVALKYHDLNVKKLVTIAGNLDVKAWTDYHHLPPLTESDDLQNYQAQYAQFKQKHYVGTDDDNIVPQITENFVADKATIVYVQGASHNSGWQKAYMQIRAD